MSRSEVQKIKLLALYDFLCRETDENNPLSMIKAPSSPYYLEKQYFT